MSTDKPIHKLANTVRDLLTRHIQNNTAEDDARREMERDEKVKAAIAQLATAGKLPPRASTPASVSEPAAPARDETGADPAVVAWAPGTDIHGSKHRLRIVPDNQLADAYSSETVWAVLIDPPSAPGAPCPIWQPQIVLREKPRTVGPWLSADEVMVCCEDEQYFYLDLVAVRRQKLGWGLPAPDAKRFARVSAPGWKITLLEIVDTRTAQVVQTVDNQQLLKPLAFDPTGRALACVSSSHLVVIDTQAGKVIAQILLATLDANFERASLPVKEQLLVRTGKTEPHVFTIAWPN